MSIRKHLFIKGRVQGVTFRSSLKNKACELDVSGWVRNLDDGRVEAVFEGETDAVQRLIEWCHQGPMLARVDNIRVIDEEKTGIEGFRIRR